MSVQMINGLSEIADSYDLFLIDQWGVLHNGQDLHPGAMAAMNGLKRAGKKVVILSNSGKRVADSYERLSKLGIGRDLYIDVVTSGETVHAAFMARNDPFYHALGSRVLVYSWDDNRGIIEGTGLTEVHSLDEADFILCAGTDRMALSAYEEDLQVAAERGLPMICANPDMVSVDPDGTLKMCPGTVARAYEELGGVVRWHGKPTREIYEHCYRIAGPFGKAIGIGDSLAHDIKGAENGDADSLFICGGIHSTELGDPPNEGGVEGLAAEYGVHPDYASPMFNW